MKNNEKIFDVYSEWISPHEKRYFANVADIKYGPGVTVEAGGFDTLAAADAAARKFYEEDVSK